MSPFGSPSAGTNSANSCRRTRTIARSVRRRTLRLEPPALARFRSEAIAIQSASVSSETSPRIHQDHHDSATPKFGPSESPAPVRAASLRDPATTGPRRPPRYQPETTLPSHRARKMRPADLCKPELSKTSTRASGAYPASQVMSPTHVMRCAVHAVAASFGPPRGTTSSFFGRRSLLRLASSAPSPHASARTRTESYDQGRFSRRLVTGDALHDPKHLPPTNALLRARDRRAGVATFATVLAVPHPTPTKGFELDRALTHSRNRACARRSDDHLPESASSRKHEHGPPNVRTSHGPKPFQLRNAAREGLRAARHPEKPGWRPEGAGPASRRTTSQRVHEARRPTGARRALTCRHSIHAMRLVNADVCRLAKARLESSHANATTFSEP